MSFYITSSFSMRMLDMANNNCAVEITSTTLKTVIESVKAAKRNDFKVVDAMRSQALARYISNISNGEIPVKGSMQMFKLERDEAIFFAHYVGDTLPRSFLELPEGGRIDWYIISLLEKVAT